MRMRMDVNEGYRPQPMTVKVRLAGPGAGGLPAQRRGTGLAAVNEGDHEKSKPIQKRNDS